jgi:hypothetical protein
VRSRLFVLYVVLSAAGEQKVETHPYDGEVPQQANGSGTHLEKKRKIQLITKVAHSTDFIEAFKY